MFVPISFVLCQMSKLSFYGCDYCFFLMYAPGGFHSLLIKFLYFLRSDNKGILLKEIVQILEIFPLILKTNY